MVYKQERKDQHNDFKFFDRFTYKEPTLIVVGLIFRN